MIKNLSFEQEQELANEIYYGGGYTKKYSEGGFFKGTYDRDNPNREDMSDARKLTSFGSEKTAKTVGASIGVVGAAAEAIGGDTGNVVGSAAKYAQMGMVAGPIGAGVGALIGAGVGLVQNKKKKKEEKAAQQKLEQDEGYNMFMEDQEEFAGYEEGGKIKTGETDKINNSVKHKKNILTNALGLRFSVNHPEFYNQLVDLPVDNVNTIANSYRDIRKGAKGITGLKSGLKYYSGLNLDKLHEATVGSGIEKQDIRNVVKQEVSNKIDLGFLGDAAVTAALKAKNFQDGGTILGSKKYERGLKYASLSNEESLRLLEQEKNIEKITGDSYKQEFLDSFNNTYSDNTRTNTLPFIESKEKRLENFVRRDRSKPVTQNMLDMAGAGPSAENVKFAQEFEVGGMTKGAYSHSSNPLTVVDKNGKDTGMELTGGEGVFDKPFMGKLSNLLAGGRYQEAGKAVQQEMSTWKHK